MLVYVFSDCTPYDFQASENPIFFGSKHQFIWTQLQVSIIGHYNVLERGCQLLPCIARYFLHL